jgi:hypothetical protein
MEENEKYYELSEDFKSIIQTQLDKICLFNLKVKYIGNSKLKQVIKLQKANDVMSYLSGVDLIIHVNEDYANKMDDVINEILIFQELDRLEFNVEKGTFKIGKFLLQTTPGVLKKYGIDAVSEANEITKLLTEQNADSDDVEDFKVKTLSSAPKSDLEFLS